MAIKKNIYTVPNGVDIDYFRNTKGIAIKLKYNNIIFVGSMDVTMNIEAVYEFCTPSLSFN